MIGSYSGIETVSFSSEATSPLDLFHLKTMLEVTPMKEKNRIAAGINWRSTIITPIMIHRAGRVPISLRLIVFGGGAFAA